MSTVLTPSDEPDFTKPLSRFNATYWAMAYGIAAMLDHADWKVLCAIYAHLPDAYPGKGRLELLSGVSASGVKRARPALKAAGLIDYPDDLKGGAPREGTRYKVADIRDPATAQQVLDRLTRSTMDPVHHEPGSSRTPTGVTVNPLPVHHEPGTGVTMDPEVHNGSTQVRTQGKNDSAAARLGGLASAPSPSLAGVNGQVQSAVVNTDLTDAHQTGQNLAGQTPAPTATQPTLFDSGVDRPAKAHQTVTGAAAGSPTSGKTLKVKDGPKSPRPAGLTDAEKRWATESLKNMVHYLVYGCRAMTQPLGTLKTTTMDWGGANNGLPDVDATAPQLAGYYWFRLSEARDRMKATLSVPAHGRLIGAVKAAKETRTQSELVALIDTITTRWPEIVTAIQWKTGLRLDEGTLQDPDVIEVAKRLMAGQPAVEPVKQTTTPTPPHRVSGNGDDELRAQIIARFNNSPKVAV